MKTNEIPSQEQLNELFEYRDGDLYWKKKPNGRYKKGSKVGSPKTSGYISTTIKKTPYVLHRLIWCYHNGQIPEGYDVHHKNEQINDNRIENLELKSIAGHRSKHHLNAVKNKKGNPSGIDLNYKRWRARATVDGIRYTIGHFDRRDQAIKARHDFLNS